MVVPKDCTVCGTRGKGLGGGKGKPCEQRHEKPVLLLEILSGVKWDCKNLKGLGEIVKSN